MTMYRVPLPDDVKDAMNEIARDVDSKLPKGYGFVLMIFPMNEAPAGIGYISNANRQDVRAALAEYLKVDAE